MACLSPIKIPNTNYGLANIGLNFVYDCDNKYLYVPCGHCSECQKLKQIYIVQRCQMQVLAGYDLYYGTLTYNNASLPTIDIGNKRYHYADFRDVSLMFKRIRKGNLLGTDFLYYVISEYGGKRYRPHFHFILAVKDIGLSRVQKISRGLEWHDIILKEWRRNWALTISPKTGKWIPNTRRPDWRPLCTYVNRNGRRNFDFHYVDPSLTDSSELDVAFYITKYIHKSSSREKLRSYLKMNYDADEASYYWRLLNPRSISSHGFGAPEHPKVKAHIRKGLNLAISEGSPFFFFINHQGKTFPLCPYYIGRCTDYKDRLSLYYNHNPDDVPDIEDKIRNFYKVVNTMNKNNRVNEKIVRRDVFDSYDFED